MDQYELKNIIECLLFVSSKPITTKKFAEVIKEFNKDEVEKSLVELAKGYDVANKPIFIQKVGGGWRMATRKEYGPWVKSLFQKEISYKLSKAALEILAIITYRQPVTIQEIEMIRGVSSGGVLRGLLEKSLVKIAGRKEAIGRPVLYRTTEKFLEYFGLESISDIPPLEELGIDKEVQELIDSIEKEDAESDNTDDEQQETLFEEDIEIDEENSNEQIETLSDEDTGISEKQQSEAAPSSKDDGCQEEEGEKADGRIQKED
ncbi:MAG: SMC-Scp complex subunit ScpB [Elusimicrobiota bacterium]